MEKTDVASTPEQKTGKKLDLARTVIMVLLVLASLLLGFYVGTRYGLDIATSAALEYLEYQAADPVEIDLDLLDSEPAAVYGSDDADKTVKVFIDLQCPSCSTFTEESLKDLQEDKTVRIEFYDYPADTHKYSRVAAAYSRCAVRQGVDYLSFIGHLNNDYSEWTSMLKESNVSEYLLQTAIKYGADEDKMNLCVIGNDVYQAIDSNVANAAVLGVEGTPSFIIGNHLITGYVSRRTFNSMMKEFSN
ncbi:MAG: DsbA family protein [Anaerolineaceae bacterium]|nr:DsbA family protein [Anaerolineaceae bacterium]